MSNLLKIFVRNDLKMRKGKMAAQSGHAAMKLFFEAMVQTHGRMTLMSKQHAEFLEFFQNLQVVEFQSHNVRGTPFASFDAGNVQCFAVCE